MKTGVKPAPQGGARGRGLEALKDVRAALRERERLAAERAAQEKAARLAAERARRLFADAVGPVTPLPPSIVSGRVVAMEM